MTALKIFPGFTVIEMPTPTTPVKCTPKIIKEYCKLEAGSTRLTRFILRHTSYTHRLNKIIELFDEARRDFPDLPLADVEVIQYGGQRYKRTFGIEFSLNDAPIPAEYAEVAKVENTL